MLSEELQQTAKPRKRHDCRHSKDGLYAAKHEARLSNISDQRFFASLRMTALKNQAAVLSCFLRIRGSFLPSTTARLIVTSAISSRLGNVVHDVKHNAFEHRTQRTRAGAFRDSLRGERAQRIFCHRQADSLH